MENKNRRRSIWATDEMWDRITQCAQAEDRRVSSWIRGAIQRALDVRQAATVRARKNEAGDSSRADGCQ